MNRIRVDAKDGIGHITLARPEKKNALDLQTALELYDALEVLEHNPTVRSVLLTAEGHDFCAGADLGALAELLDAGIEAQQRDAETLGRVFLTIRTMSKPVIAGVQGRALAGGAGLATACDIVIADENAQFGYPEVRVGFVPAMVMTMLRRVAGEKRAFDLVVSGRTITAQEALQIGLVSRVVPSTEFEQSVVASAAAIAAFPESAVRTIKRLFYQLDPLSFDEGIALGVRTNVEARQTEEFRKGVQRFVRRDRP